jgi:hypothetical protein
MMGIGLKERVLQLAADAGLFGTCCVEAPAQRHGRASEAPGRGRGHVRWVVPLALHN